jgi:hypothetical protein
MEQEKINHGSERPTKGVFRRDRRGIISSGTAEGRGTTGRLTKITKRTLGFLCELAKDVGDKLRTSSNQRTSITRVAEGSQVLLPHTCTQDGLVSATKTPTSWATSQDRPF